MRLKLLASMLVMFAASAASSHELELDTAGAHAVIEALAKPGLTLDEAKGVAALPANQQLIRKVGSFGTDIPAGTFESELVAVAHGQTPANERFGFSRVKSDLPKVAETLAALEANRVADSRWILERVQQFSPPGPSLKLKGWIIAGGNSTGFAFGGPEFYLKINDFVGAPDYLRLVMAHELYHAVQGAAMTAGKRTLPFDDVDLDRVKSKPQRDYHAVNMLLTQLMTEGIASYVGDPTLSTSEARLARQERDRIRNMERLPRRMPTLLDMALLSITDAKPLSSEDVYSVGFYADQPLYYLGYSMAKAIAAKKGSARLGELALGDGCAFGREYLAFTAADASLPKLGERSAAIIGSACPAS